MVATLLGSESPRVNKNLGGTKDFLTGPKDDLFVSKLVVVAAGSDGLHPPPSAAGPSAAAGPSSAAEGGAEGGAAGVGGASGAGGAAGTSGAAGAGLQVVERGPDLTAGVPAPKLLVRAVMDGQDGTDGRQPCRTCNPMWWRLRPFLMAPATPCDTACSPTWRRKLVLVGPASLLYGPDAPMDPVFVELGLEVPLQPDSAPSRRVAEPVPLQL